MREGNIASTTTEKHKCGVVCLKVIGCGFTAIAISPHMINILEFTFPPCIFSHSLHV
jgi:hypothetical protein